MSDILVTAKSTPDLDGVSCSLAYADLLKQTGQDVEGMIFGELQSEVRYFVDKQKIILPRKDNDGTGDWQKFILVDASSIKGMPKIVRAEDVIEIIDHREGDLKVGELPNAKIQNEFIGAAATLIVERFQQQNKEILPDHAKLLYGAIFHNTLNLLASNTDVRDMKAIEFLESEFNLNRNLIQEMFIHATEFIVANLDQALRDDSKNFDSPYGKYLFCQLVIWGGSIQGRETELAGTLKVLANEIEGKFAILNVIDIEKNRSLLYSPDELGKRALERAIGVSFESNWATISPALLRKQIFPKIKNLVLE